MLFLFAKHPLFQDVLLDLQNQEKVHAANRLLADFNSISQTLNTYLLDTDGIVQASSNWDSDASFIDEDLSFRPYFQDAIKDGSGYYFALGSTSKKRGFYFSAAIYHRQTSIGVIVIKVNLDRVEDNLAEFNRRIAISDPDGVIFISNEPDWVYHTLTPLEENQLAELRASRRYADNPLDPIPFENISTETASDHIVSIKLDNMNAITQLIHNSISVPERGWVIHAFSNYSNISDHVRRSLIAVFSLFALTLAIAVIVYLKQQAKKQGERIRQATLGALEREVKVRTAELMRSNDRLKSEILERKQTERELTAAQDSLVQATKMAALGKMATSISHEISQPLGAISAFAENAHEYIKRDDLVAASANLDLITKMGGRMRSIIQNLKAFARKTPIQLKPVCVDNVIQETLELMHAASQKLNISVRYKPSAEPFLVIAEPVGLQQVLTNLVQNAFDAVQHENDKTIEISVQRIEDTVQIHVTDFGAGIDPALKDSLFEPFSSSKNSGEGLGLGLSLSYGIVEGFGGNLTASEGPLQGATFTIHLKMSSASVNSASVSSVSA